MRSTAYTKCTTAVSGTVRARAHAQIPGDAAKLIWLRLRHRPDTRIRRTGAALIRSKFKKAHRRDGSGASTRCWIRTDPRAAARPLRSIFGIVTLTSTRALQDSTFTPRERVSRRDGAATHVDDGIACERLASIASRSRGRIRNRAPSSVVCQCCGTPCFRPHTATKRHG